MVCVFKITFIGQFLIYSSQVVKGSQGVLKKIIAASTTTISKTITQLETFPLIFNDFVILNLC